MPQDTIIGYTDKEFYVLRGKLADGTPVYVFDAQLKKNTLAHREHLRQEKEKLLYEQRKKVVEDYNTRSDVAPNDPNEMLSKLHEEEEKERQIPARKDTLKYIVHEPAEDTVVNEDSPSILDYYKEVKQEVQEKADTCCYLMMFQLDEQQRKEKRARIKHLQEQRQRAIEEDDRKRLQNADKYERMLNTLSRLEFDYHIQIREYVMNLEAELLEAYKHILQEEDYEELYTDDAEYDIVIHADVRAVVITNKDNNVTGTFNYYGNLQQNPEISGYKLRLYSMSKDEEETARFLRQNNNIREACVGIITHRHTTYDLRTGEIIENETFVVTKFDPEIVSTQECQNEIYNEANLPGLDMLPDAGKLVWSSGPTVSSYPGRGYGSSDKAFLDPEGVGGDVRASYGGLPGVSGRGGYIISETDRASSTFIHVTSGSGEIQDIWLQRVAPVNRRYHGGGVYLGAGKGSIKYRTITGPQAADTAIYPDRYADILGFKSGHAMLTAVDALCAEPGVDFSVTSGTLVWESGQINGYNIVDGDDVVSSGWRQLTGIKILENFESEGRMYDDYNGGVGPVSGITHVHNDTSMTSPGQTRSARSVDPIPYGDNPYNFRNRAIDKIFWVQLRDMTFAGTDAFSLGTTIETTADSYPLSTVQHTESYKVRQFGKPVYQNNMRWFGLSSQVYFNNGYIDYNDYFDIKQQGHSTYKSIVSARETVDSIPIRIPSRHHGFLTISYGIGSATGLMGSSLWSSDDNEFEDGTMALDRNEEEGTGPTYSIAHFVSAKNTMYTGYGDPTNTSGGKNKNWTIIPDGSTGGLCVLGVSRLSGCYGKITVRVILSAGIPNFSNSKYSGVAGIPNQSTTHSAAANGVTAWGWCGGGPGTYAGDNTTRMSRTGLIGTDHREIYFKRMYYDVGTAGATYGSIEADADWRIPPYGPVVNGYPLSAVDSYKTDPLSANIGVLQWDHGEMGTKHIILEAGNMRNGTKGNSDSTENLGLQMTRWGCVFLSYSLDKGPFLEDGNVLSPWISGRDPNDSNNSPDPSFLQSNDGSPAGAGAGVLTMTPTLCCVLANQGHGRDKGTGQLGHNIYNDDQFLNTSFVGSSANPFFIGISGWMGYHNFVPDAALGSAEDKSANPSTPWY